MTDGNNDRRKSRVNWDDSTVPVGNAPPLPRWPVVVAGLAWLAWLVFLIALLISRGGAAGA